jgi:serine protease inhibitor
MRATLKGLLLALFVCVLPLACVPEESGSGGEPGSEVPLHRAETQRNQEPYVNEEQVAEHLLGNNAFAFDLYRAEAAATVLMMPGSSAPEPVEVSADRPFIFAISERETGEILFLGRVTNPKS